MSEKNEPNSNESPPNSELVVVEIAAPDPLAWLTEPERYALDRFQARRDIRGESGTFALATSVQLQLFELYLAGRTFSEIRALNTQWGLGQIVHAGVMGRWNEHRAVYLDDLFTRARDRARQVVSEAAEFIGDSLTAAHKQHGAAMRRYIQTGDPDELGAFAIASPHQYKEQLEMFLKATGQDNVKRVSGSVEVNHTVQQTLPPAAPTKTNPKASLARFAAAERERQIKDKK